MSTLYSTPLPTHQQLQSTARSRSRKRKRHTTQVDQKEHDESSSSDAARAQTAEAREPEEYAAVISPRDREQRRLARYSLVDPLPPPPFPHRQYQDRYETTRKPYTHSQSPFHSGEDATLGSLRSQHLAAMTALLHKCLQKKDYVRASRALGLILRTDVNGKPIDIRAAGNWAIGAEILLRRDVRYRRQRATRDGHTSIVSMESSLPFTRQGFEQAKELYETLIIQHPYQKSWPDSVNAIDFYLAMFSLWIYVAQAKAIQQQEELDDNQASDPALDYLAVLQDFKLAQLRQANKIEDRMENCMTSALYSDNKDLIRMRAMLALWRVDLSIACQEFTQMDMDEENNDGAADAEGVADAVGVLQIRDTAILSSKQLTQAALAARKLARQNFERLGISQQDDASFS